MEITSLDQMETIVANNKSLSWDGWTVVDSIKNQSGWTKPNGAFINGQWYVQNRYAATESGWKIPGKFVR